jgi:thymidylate synthase (FAD)
MSIETFSYPTVQLIDKMGGDHSIVRAARVSVSSGEIIVDTEDLEEIKRNNGLINYLMREKHGSPFEQNSMTFYVKAPIFVFREFHRHRAGFSYNEMSGRYTKLNPEFWIPARNRPLVNAGTSAKPNMVPGTEEQHDLAVEQMTWLYEQAWETYQELLDAGIANEVARAVLPVGIYSQMYVTLNLRSAFNFLSLRTHEPEARHVSRPQKEIEDVAREMEKHIAQLFPQAYKTFNEHGRVAP